MALSKVGKNQVDQSASLTVDSDLTVDTNTLYVDSTNNRVGIGTTSPSSLVDGRLSGTSSGDILSIGNTGSGVFGGIAISDGGTYPVRHWGSSLEFYTGSSIYSSATERMRIDSSGRVTMPYQPAFTASGGSSPTHGAGVLRYSSTSQDGFNLNVGGHYNTSNYRFTAPVSGNYFFCFNSYTDGSNGFDAGFYINGVSKGPQIQDLSTRTGSNTYVSLSVSTIIPLNANDYVDVATTYQAYVDSNCFFSGYLIG